MSAVIGFVEHGRGSLTESSLEMITFARDLAGVTGSALEAVTFGPEGDAVVDALGAYGVETVHHVTIDRVEAYAPQAWGESIGQLVDATAPEAVVAPGTDRGQEVLAHVGASRDLPMAANCLSVDVEDDGGYRLVRQRWGGSLLEHARLDADTKLLSATEHEFPIEEAPEATTPTVEPVTPDLGDREFRVTVDRFQESDVEGVPLGEARVVVSGGRGVGGPDGFDQLQELADLLGGALGASRAAVYEGWRPHDDQIGLTGAKINPEIYIPCGISGAIQHMVGCKGAERILAINNDPEAAIMQKADYAVVGDLHEVVPALIEAIRAEKG